MNESVIKALDDRDELFKRQLDEIGSRIGYGRAIQLLGQLWDDMMQARYPSVGRHQESMHRRSDIEKIESGEPIGRKLVYYQKRGRRGLIAAWMPFGETPENVGAIVSDTPLFGPIAAQVANKPTGEGA